MNKTKLNKNTDKYFKCHLINLYTNKRADSKVYNLNKSELEQLNYALALNSSEKRYAKI